MLFSAKEQGGKKEAILEEWSDGALEYWSAGKRKMQKTEERGQSHRTSEARGQEDNGNTTESTK
jgi:hypothetical protein